ncbi:MAG: mannose-1-phosphate guanylyltransferase/mannose-6-phosphate isomerase [Porticoccaceae bacterium]|nr:MAG: mannose-1-phosphate guanylyltransferase/mannose-6-phosphate isomerase [Porticoccaceae bacterium]
MIPVILSGGSGERLWPRSRRHYPKQFLPLADPARSLIQATAARTRALGLAAPLVVCNREHRFLVADQLAAAGIPPRRILLEPCPRNTAPAVATAALWALAAGGEEDPLLLVLPADHVLGDPAALAAALSRAEPAARAGRLVALGVSPQRPETGYGYLELGESLPEAPGAYALRRFVEKPPRADAEHFCAQGGWLWNSGIFLFSARTYLAELERFSPQMVTACRAALEAAEAERDFCWLDEAAFAACPADSVDYAVMERTARAAAVPLETTWSDVGSWQALWELGPRDGAGNVLRGEVVALDARRCYASAERRLVALLGVEDLVVVDSDDALLVARRDRAQEVKRIVAELERRGDEKHLVHRKVYRPWGHYDSVDEGEGFKVKRITVKPGGRLSLQKHRHRAEHWIVVRGTARVTCGDSVRVLSANESTYIPMGAVHRLENPGEEDLELIEVQSGTYLGEDDIVRLEDAYGRARE